MRETLLRLPLRIELDEVKGYFFNLCLCLFLQFLPDIAAQLIYFGNGAILARVFGYLM